MPQLCQQPSWTLPPDANRRLSVLEHGGSNIPRRFKNPYSSIALMMLGSTMVAAAFFGASGRAAHFCEYGYHSFVGWGMSGIAFFRYAQAESRARLLFDH
jgi:hypothetical protein